MATVEYEPIMGVWGQSPQHGPGTEPLVRRAKPPEAESFLSIFIQIGSQKFMIKTERFKLKYAPS